MIGVKFKKTGHVTLTTPFLRVACHHRLRFDTVYLHAKFDDSNFILASEVPQISLGVSKYNGHR